MQSLFPLPRGVVVALIEPASGFDDETLYQSSIDAVRTLGFKPRLYRSQKSASLPHLAASDAGRVECLHQAFCDDEARAVFCLRGGYGTLRLLDAIDYELIRTHSKPLLGFSDITALELACFAHGAPIGIHAPMPPRYHELTPAALRRLKCLLVGKSAAEYTASDGLFSIHPGEATGPMIGGNLSLIAALCGTKHLPRLDGAILFLEDVGEDAGHLDRLFCTLKLCGVFERVSGVVLGAFSECADERLIRRMADELVPKEIPVLGGFPAGHILNHHAFIQGQSVSLCTAKARLRLS